MISRKILYIWRMEVDKKLYQEIKQYCELNGLKPSEYVNSTLKKAFMEDKYGSAPFLRKDQDLALNGNKSFNDAVNDEVKRILNNEEEMKKFFSEVNRAANEIHSKGTRVASFIEVTDEQKKALENFEKKMLDGMKEAQETEKEISDYMEKNSLEPVSMEELIYGDDESGQSTVKNVQILPDYLNDAIASGKALETVEIQPNVQKTDVNLDKKPKKRTIKPIK